jgi:DNA mismatch repair protein MutL
LLNRAPPRIRARTTTTPSPIRSAPRAQVHDTFIIAETENSLIIVDQHAAHERLVYERLKKAFANGELFRQMLLIPEVVSLPLRLPSGSPPWREN